MKKFTFSSIFISLACFVSLSQNKAAQSDNIFVNPNPALIKVADSGKLTKEQAVFDIDALIYSISEVHPDMFHVCNHDEFFRAVNQAKKSMPDSVTPLQLYRYVAPIIAMIGDGHTSLNFPFNSVFTKGIKRMPVFVDVLPDKSIICTSSFDSIITHGARIISINDVSADSIVNSMMPFVSGERPHYKIALINHLFSGLHHMLYSEDKYEVKYQPKDSDKVLSHTFQSITFDEIKERCPSAIEETKAEDYSYSIDILNNIAIMDFQRFSDVSRMEQFADSMFKELAQKNISSLIIDIRNNSGGNSQVGDVILRYISPKPFIQTDRVLVRETPLTSNLLGKDSSSHSFIFQEIDTTQFIQPRTPEEGHYDGDVYLLISNKTFSSASSFAWAFKECGIGETIGEETGGMNIHFGDIVKYSLPISNLSANISHKRFWQLRAVENDIHGTIPNIAVAADQALDTAMKIIIKLLESGKDG